MERERPASCSASKLEITSNDTETQLGLTSPWRRLRWTGNRWSCKYGIRQVRNGSGQSRRATTGRRMELLLVSWNSSYLSRGCVQNSFILRAWLIEANSYQQLLGWRDNKIFAYVCYRGDTPIVYESVLAPFSLFIQQSQLNLAILNIGAKLKDSPCLIWA